MLQKYSQTIANLERELNRRFNFSQRYTIVASFTKMNQTLLVLDCNPSNDCVQYNCICNCAEYSTVEKSVVVSSSTRYLQEGCWF